MREPTLFDNPMYETANEAVLFCQKYLEDIGHIHAAESLGSMLPVNTPVIGRVVHRVLLDLQKGVRGECAQYVSVAVNALERALRTPTFKAAS